MKDLRNIRNGSSKTRPRARLSLQGFVLSPRAIVMALVMAAAAPKKFFCRGFTIPSRTFARNDSQPHVRRLPALCLKSDNLTTEERDLKVQKATKAMTAFTNSYLRNTDTKLCEQKSIPAVVIKGLAEHKVDLGAPLCPCRFYEDKEKEVKEGYWNCPCVPMREEKMCHCMLFLTDDNAFAGESQSITVDEVLELTDSQK
mmetsp:Transcript_10705/g.25757  ORF Transcript_10705/g.25757 Transcript_10705/m.25757 type:complete len:200 (+) Transcript_10705:206-805(+)|eukprot:CAMPEP_0197174604 /NCGR_PEP_ID=MMETSP1423-20130617/1048_1 /TAXON_ID=476441 /ORGANISM="Pseudo-nitzschia heimii, Strain UNC1101" /LENGTH=199 /DNA_ID=CAMNT_0042623547 /DNA_START=153 /DNA_END=752 /DNA_ORIENTATION=-